MPSKAPTFDVAMPSAPESERAFLGAIIIQNNVYFRADLRTTDFFDDRCRYAYEAICYLFEEREPVDLLSLSVAMKKLGTLDRVGGPAFLGSLTDTVPNIAGCEFYAAEIIRTAKKRAGVLAGYALVKASLDPETEPDEVASAAMASLGSVATREEAQARPIASVLSDAFERQERLATEGRSVALDVGWDTLNSHKIFHSTFIVCTAAKGSGKTALMVDWSRRLAKNGHPNAIFTLESTEHEIGLRYASMDTSIPHSWMRDWRPPVFTESHRERARQCLREARDLGIHIVQGMRSVEEILLEIRRLKLMHGIQAAFVDYVQLVGTKQRYERHELGLSNIARSFLGAAIDNDVAVCAFSQVNKEGNVAYADSIEQSARVRIHFERPHADDRTRRCMIPFQIIKNNEERTGAFWGHFSESTQQWTEVSDRWERAGELWSVACEEAGHIRTERKLFT